MDSRDYLTTLNQIADAVIQLTRSISDSKWALYTDIQA
jgi:hypothetical protein